jgi:hypothetical protein
LTTERKRTRDRRKLSTGRPRNYRDLYKADPSATPAQPSAPTTISASSVEKVDWAREYAYVGHDLRRLGLVSMVLLALIVVAGFFF